MSQAVTSGYPMFEQLDRKLQEFDGTPREVICSVTTMRALLSEDARACHDPTMPRVWGRVMRDSPRWVVELTWHGERMVVT